MATPKTTDGIFLGLDSSTQGLKATAVDLDLGVVGEYAVNFDRDLPEFGTEGGVHRDGLAVTSPTLMWVAAVDLLLERMKSGAFAFNRVAAISGSGQQHGSVYWKTGARVALQSLSADGSLRDHLAVCFAVPESPIWMDSSTQKQCRERDEALGGPQAVAELTGSRSYERFTGNQIAKVRQIWPLRYEQTERISLVSSFAASLLIGDYAPIDASDGSGMNLMDLRSKTWARRALEVTGPALEERLGGIVESHADIGPIHGRYVRRYGFSPACRVIAFSGDNPNSLAALRLQSAGDVAISLGTSDTVFGSLAEPRPSASEGHIFANPVDPGGYMALICYKNGSLTREKIRDERAGGSWDAFSDALARTSPGNGGCIGFYIVEPEITPPILATGIHRFGPDGRERTEFPSAVDVRAVVEGQFLSMRLHGLNVGLNPCQILATGGASSNHAILQVMADVFGVTVSTADQPNSASLGAAYRALHGWVCRTSGQFVPFGEALRSAPPFRKTASPNPAARGVYKELLDRYSRCEKRVISPA